MSCADDFKKECFHASDVERKKLFKKFALKYHPDKHGNQEWAKDCFQEMANTCSPDSPKPDSPKPDPRPSPPSQPRASPMPPPRYRVNIRCRCDNGSPAYTCSEEYPLEIKCLGCNPGFKKVNDQCVVDWATFLCSCNNGTPESTCMPNLPFERCSTCYPGYSKVGRYCEEDISRAPTNQFGSLEPPTNQFGSLEPPMNEFGNLEPPTNEFGNLCDCRFGNPQNTCSNTLRIEKCESCYKGYKLRGNACVAKTSLGSMLQAGLAIATTVMMMML